MFKHTAQAGITLIELMIGLLLCAFSILISLTLYQNLVVTSVESRTDAQQDAQMASAMASLQLELQSAGYGIVGANGDQIKLLAGNQHLNWRYFDGANFQCRGLWIESPAPTSRIIRLMRKNICDAASILTTATAAEWTEVSELASFNRLPPAITIAMAAVNCTPYGLGDPANHYQVVITADSSVSRAGGAPANSYSFCLANLTP